MSFFMRLARADIVFYILPFFMLVLTLGTLAQAEMGLFEAHQKYFAAAFFMWGPLPLPGGYLLIGLFTLNLLLKFILGSEWRWRKIGIILSHAGALVLLLGGLLTAVFAQESFMVIPEGQANPYLYDYHQRDLVIYRDDKAAFTVPFDTIQQGKIIEVPNADFTLTPLNVCINCAIDRREDSDQDFAETPLHSMAQFMALSSKAEEKESEANLSGMTLQLDGSDQDGIYLAFEAMPKPMEFTAGDAYHSDVTVEDNGASWPARIAMNKPLRYKGYTFFQSAYERDQSGEEITILAVVENKGRIFPYLGTIIITIGLLAHLIIVLRRKGSA